MKYSILIICVLIVLLVVPKTEAFVHDLSLRKDKEITIIGCEESPLFSAYNLFISNNKIYIPDYLGNAVNVYDENGNHLVNLKAVLLNVNDDFNMPYGVVVDEEENIYINDRGNQRILVFNKEYHIINRFKVDTQLELILLSDNSIIGVAVAPSFKCSRNKYCLLIEMDKMNGKKKTAFGFFEKEYVTYSWAASVNKNMIFICNKYDNKIYVFDKTRNVTNIIELDYPSISIQKNIINKVKSKADLLKNKRTLSQNAHFTIGRIHVLGDKIIIQYRERGGKSNRTKYHIEFLDSRGERKSENIHVIGEMYPYGEMIYCVETDNSEKYGKIRIIGYKID